MEPWKKNAKKSKIFFAFITSIRSHLSHAHKHTKNFPPKRYQYLSIHLFICLSTDLISYHYLTIMISYNPTAANVNWERLTSRYLYLFCQFLSCVYILFFLVTLLSFFFLIDVLFHVKYYLFIYRFTMFTSLRVCSFCAHLGRHRVPRKVFMFV